MADKDQDQIDLPDHTRMQLVAVAQAVVAAAVAFGVPISDQQSVALIALAGVIGTVLIGSDAAIRRARANNADKLRPQGSVHETRQIDGAQVTTSVRGPLGDADDLDDIREMLARLQDAVEELHRPRRTANGRRTTASRH